MPIEQPTKSEFAINLKTAKVLGLRVLASLLARADGVIEQRRYLLRCMSSFLAHLAEEGLSAPRRKPDVGGDRSRPLRASEMMSGIFAERQTDVGLRSYTLCMDRLRVALRSATRVGSTEAAGGRVNLIYPSVLGGYCRSRESAGASGRTPGRTCQTH
jgi:hypothetical protein